VDQELESNVVVERAFWVAAALAALGGVAPLLVAIGQSNRIGAVLFPFAGATVAMAVVALFYRHGRSLAAIVYFLGGLALTYGLLLGLSVPMRLAVTGSCPPAPERCAAGFELQLTSQETTGLTIAVAFGIMSLLAGFLGLSVLYRQHRVPASRPTVWPARPPETPAPAPPPPAESKPEPEPDPEPMPEPALVTEPEAPPPAPPPAPAPVAEVVTEAKPKRKRRTKPPTG
jgi:hypothetical protein